MYVLRVAVEPDSESSLHDLDEPLGALLEQPLLNIEGIDGIEGVQVAPDGRSAFVPLVVSEDLDLPSAAMGTILLDAATSSLSGTAASVDAFMAAPSPAPCPVCGQTGGHDWSKHLASATPTGGLERL